MSKSEVRVYDDGSIEIRLSAAPRWLGCWAPSTIRVAADEIEGMWRSDSSFVGHRLRWKIAGGGFSRQRIMGWFSWIGNRGRWAWVWITPGRKLLVLQTSRKKPALVVVPLDWVVDKNSLERLRNINEWSG